MRLVVIVLMLASIALSQGNTSQNGEENVPYCSRAFEAEGGIKLIGANREMKRSGSMAVRKGTFEKTSLSANVSYSMSDLSSMSHADMVNAIASVSWRNISGLWNRNTTTLNFFGDQNRVKYLMAAIEARGATFTATDDKGIPTMVEVVRAGFYHARANNPASWLTTRSGRESTFAGQNAIAGNSNFKVGQAGQNNVVWAFGAYVGNSAFSPASSLGVKGMYQNYVNDGLVPSATRVQGSALYKAMTGIGGALDWSMYRAGRIGPNSPYYNQIDAYIDGLKLIVAYGQNGSWDWLINNGIYFISEAVKLSADKYSVNRVLTDNIQTYDAWSMPQLELHRAIYRVMDDIDANGMLQNWSSVKVSFENHYLPNTRVFDDGKVVARYGGDVTEEKITRLYWATKEVSAQFYKIIGNDKALTSPAVDDVLTMVIYNNPTEYKFNKILNGVSVSNGGMYIEPWGKFFTYERTPAQSIYSLEELFRHEFTHYLQGRFFEHGMWQYSSNDGSIYDHGRMHWISEGMAEFMAGSTRENGVQPRYSVSRELYRDNPSRYFSAGQLFNSRYSDGWDFYQYGYAYWHYLYNDNQIAMKEIIKLILVDNDGQGLGNYLQSIASSTTTAYKARIATLAQNYTSATDNAVSNHYLIEVVEPTLSSIQSHISSKISLSDVSITSISSPTHKLFKLTGTSAANNIGALTNNSLATINDGSWHGYRTVNVHHANKRQQNGQWIQDVVYTGKLSGSTSGVNSPPIAKHNGPYAEVLGSLLSFSSAGSHDIDGNIVEYLWDFGDGNTSPLPNPDHTYANGGTFSVTLTVTDDDSSSTVVATTAEISSGTMYIVNETESNNTINTANGPVGSSVSVIGTLDGNRDMFYFDLDSAGTVEIDLDIDNGATFVLYHESNVRRYVGWVTRNDGRHKLTTYNGKAGRTYISIYGWAGGPKNYILSIESTSIEQPLVMSTPIEFGVTSHPNPFNPVTNIQFSLPQRSAVYMTIFNIMGQKVKSMLTGGVLDAKIHNFRWNGTNDVGNKVSSGMYFLKIATPVKVMTKKLILLK